MTSTLNKSRSGLMSKRLLSPWLNLMDMKKSDFQLLKKQNYIQGQTKLQTSSPKKCTPSMTKVEKAFH